MISYEVNLYVEMIHFNNNFEFFVYNEFLPEKNPQECSEIIDKSKYIKCTIYLADLQFICMNKYQQYYILSGFTQPQQT